VLVASLAVEVPAAIRGRAAAHVAIAGPLQPFVGQLLAAVAMAALSLAPRPTSSGPQPLVTALGAGRAARPVPALALAAKAAPTTITTALVEDAVPPALQPAGAVAQPLRTYQVARNDTLWGIAERELGDPLRWRDIYALNQDRPQPGGARLTDPHWIDPGWTILLPAGPAAASGSPAAMPAPVAPPSAPSPSTTPSATTSPVAGRAAEGPPVHDTGSPSAQASPGPQAATGQHDPPAAPPTGTATPATVSLPSGSVVAGTFAAGVLSSVAIGRLRRRHAYQPSRPEPGRSLAPPPLGPTIRRLAAGSATPDGDDPPRIPDPTTADRQSRQPDGIEIGEQDGTTVAVDLAELSGIALCGGAADQVARAWATALLTRAGPLAAEVVATAASMEQLFPGVGEVPGLRTAEDTAQLTRILESEVVARTRKLVAARAGDAAAYRRANPDEPLPALLALLDQVAPVDGARLAPTVKTCGRLGMAVVFLADVEGASIRVRLDGSTVAEAELSDDPVAGFTGTRLFGLQAEEAVDILRALANAEFRPTSEDNPEWTEVIERMEHPNPEPQPWPDPPPAGQLGADTPVRVAALGPLTITVCGRTISRGLRSLAKELLVYYLLRPEGATIEQAVDHLWPDTDPKLVHRHFWTAAANLRTRLRETTDAESKVLDQAGEVYRLDPTVVSADLWDFQAALGGAARTGDDTAAAQALRRAVDAYRGDLAEGAGWIWAEAPREDLHRRAIDAHLRLAELEESLANSAAAVAVLERATELDRYAEEPHRRLMLLQAHQGRTDAVKATWRALQRRLVEIDLDPDPATARLYRRLVADEPVA